VTVQRGEDKVRRGGYVTDSECGELSKLGHREAHFGVSLVHRCTCRVEFWDIVTEHITLGTSYAEHPGRPAIEM
jgi:hypothetical protein